MTKSKIANVTEGLVKVINDHMESSLNEEALQDLSMGHDSVKQSINDLKESFDEKTDQLKNGFHWKLNTLIKSVDNMNIKENETQEIIHSLIGSVNSMKNEMVAIDKIRRLEWAIDQCSKGSVRDLEIDNFLRISEISEKEIVGDILLAFRRGCGFDIYEYYATYGSTNYLQESPRNYLEEYYKKFEKVITERIHLLTGVKPRIEMSNGKKMIFY